MQAPWVNVKDSYVSLYLYNIYMYIYTYIYMNIKDIIEVISETRSEYLFLYHMLNYKMALRTKSFYRIHYEIVYVYITTKHLQDK